MIADGVLVPAEHCEALGRALLRAQEAMRRDGLISPVAAKYTEELLTVARQRKILAERNAARASLQVPARQAGDLLSAREAAAVLGVSGRRIQQLAADRVIGRKISGRWLFTREECEDLARSRSTGRRDRASAA